MWSYLLRERCGTCTYVCTYSFQLRPALCCRSTQMNSVRVREEGEELVAFAEREEAALGDMRPEVERHVRTHIPPSTEAPKMQDRGVHVSRFASTEETCAHHPASTLLRKSPREQRRDMCYSNTPPVCPSNTEIQQPRASEAERHAHAITSPPTQRLQYIPEDPAKSTVTENGANSVTGETAFFSHDSVIGRHRS